MKIINKIILITGVCVLTSLLPAIIYFPLSAPIATIAAIAVAIIALAYLYVSELDNSKSSSNAIFIKKLISNPEELIFYTVIILIFFLTVVIFAPIFTTLAAIISCVFITLALYMCRANFGTCNSLDSVKTITAPSNNSIQGSRESFLAKLGELSSSSLPDTEEDANSDTEEDANSVDCNQKGFFTQQTTLIQSNIEDDTNIDSIDKSLIPHGYS